MKTDRELLELAAKAAGIEHAMCFEAYEDEPFAYCKIAKHKYWRPLTDDGDAMRLAVKLWIDFHQGENCGPAVYAGYYKSGQVRQSFAVEFHGDDPAAATRRAIVRAAAAIGASLAAGEGSAS